MPACILYFVLLSAPCVLAASFGRRYEDTLPLSVFSLLLLLYIAGLAGLLPYGVIAALALSACCLVLAAARVLTKRISCKALFGNLLTPACAAFALLFTLSVVLNAGRAPYHGDEFSHWAYTVKAMAYCNDFGTNPAAASLYASYPPGMSLMQYCLQRLSFLTSGAVYTEWMLFTPYQSTAFALVICLACRGRSWRNALTAAPLAASAVLLPAILYPLFYESIFVDPIMGLLAGFLFALAWRKERYDTLTICTACCGLAVLTLLKDAGVYFAVLCAAVLFFDLASAAKPLRAAARTALPLLIAAAKGSWALHVRLSGTPVRFSESAPLSILPGIISGQDTSFRHTAFVNYLRAPFAGRVPLGTDTFTAMGKTVPGWQFFVSFFALAVVLLVLLYALASGGDKQPASACTRRRRIIGLATLGLLVYWVGLCGLYVLKFVEFEAVALYCYERYFSIPFLMLGTLLFAAFCEQNTGKLRLVWAALLLAGMLAIAPLHCVYPYLTRRSARGSREMTEPQRTIAAFVERTVPASARLYLLAQESDGEGLMQKYLLYPRIVTGGAIGPPMYEGDPWTKNVACAEWQETLRSGYDYVLLSHVDALFIARCGDAFNEPDTIEDGELYRVDPDTGMLTHIAVQ